MTRIVRQPPLPLKKWAESLKPAPLPPNRCTHPRACWVDAEGDEMGIGIDYKCPDCGELFTVFIEPYEP